VFDKGMKKSIEAYMEPGEQLLEAAIVQGKGMTKALLAGGVAGQAVVGAMRNRKREASTADGDDGGIKLANKMGVAVTSQRLLIFKAGGAVTLKATELLSAVPVGEVDSIEVGKGMTTKPVTITVRGESFVVEAPKVSDPSKLAEALTQAKGGAPAAI
jgi:hypothetical protein